MRSCSPEDQRRAGQQDISSLLGETWRLRMETMQRRGYASPAQNANIFSQLFPNLACFDTVVTVPAHPRKTIAEVVAWNGACSLKKFEGLSFTDQQKQPSTPRLTPRFRFCTPSS